MKQVIAISLNRDVKSIVFNSKAECMEHFGIKNNDMEAYLEKGHPYQGWCFDYALSLDEERK